MNLKMHFLSLFKSVYTSWHNITNLFFLYVWWGIFIAHAHFAVINARCSKHIVAQYFVSQPLQRVVVNVCASAKLIFFHLTGCPSLLFQVFVFAPKPVSVLREVAGVCFKPVSVACLTVCITDFCVHCEK